MVNRPWTTPTKNYTFGPLGGAIMFFVINSHNTHCTLEILTWSRSLNQPELIDIGHAYFCLKVFLQYRAMRKTNFFELVLACYINTIHLC